MHLGGGADCADGEEDAGPRRQSNSGTSDVFSKINSRLGNFDGVSEKEGGGVGVEDRRVLPRAPAFLTRVHFLPSSSLPSYQLISSCAGPRPYYPYSLLPPTITAQPSPPRRTVRLQRQLLRQGQSLRVLGSSFIPSAHRAFNLSSLSSSSTAPRLSHGPGHPYRHTKRVCYTGARLFCPVCSLPVIFFAAPLFDASLLES